MFKEVFFPTAFLFLNRDGRPSFFYPERIIIRTHETYFAKYHYSYNLAYVSLALRTHARQLKRFFSCFNYRLGNFSCSVYTRVMLIVVGVLVCGVRVGFNFGLGLATGYTISFRCIQLCYYCRRYLLELGSDLCGK